MGIDPPLPVERNCRMLKMRITEVAHRAASFFARPHGTVLP